MSILGENPFNKTTRFRTEHREPQELKNLLRTAVPVKRYGRFDLGGERCGIHHI